MRTRIIFVFALLMSSIVIAPASADDWRVRFYGLYMDSGDQPVAVDDLGTTVATDDSEATGFGINAEYRPGERFGLELGLARAEHDGFQASGIFPSEDVSSTDSITINMATLGGNYHFTPASRVDLHLGAFVALMDYDEVVIRYAEGVPLPVGYPHRVSVDIDQDVGFGVDLGLDVPLGESAWSFYGDARYLLTTMEGTSPRAELSSTDYDPLIVAVGLGYGF